MQIYHDVGALGTIEPGETAYWWYSFGSSSKDGERPGDIGMTYALPRWPKWPEYLGYGAILYATGQGQEIFLSYAGGSNGQIATQYHVTIASQAGYYSGIAYHIQVIAFER